MFFQILGVIFLIVICTVGYFAWKIYRSVKAQEKSDIAIAMSVLPSQDMELEPSNSDEWKEKECLEHSESELKRVGANHIGYYCVYSGYAIIRISIWSFRNRVVTVIYEALSVIDKSNVTFIYEVACKLADGSICITSNANAVYDSRPKNPKLVFNESTSILDFIKAIKSEVPVNKKLVKIEDSLEFFAECYEDTTEWSWRSEQLTSEKTQQVLSSVGVTVSKELTDDLIEIGISYSVTVNIKRARRKLAKHSKMSVEQWEKIRDKLVFVNDKMQVHHLVDAIYDLAGDLSETQEQALDGFQTNTDELIDPISAFQMLVQSLSLKAKRITSMKSPVKTEVYLPL